MYGDLLLSEDVEEMKRCVMNMQVEKRADKYSCDSFDQNKWINKYVRFKEPLLIFRNPGEASFNTLKPNTHIGYVVGFNANGKWVKLKNPVWGEVWFLSKALNLAYITDTRKGSLTEAEQKKAEEAAAILIQQIQKGSRPLERVGTVGAEVGKGVAEVADKSLTVISFIGKNLKWILLAVLVLSVVYVFFKYKNVLK